MSADGERLEVYLEHMLQAVRRIERYTRHMTGQQFAGNEMVQDAVLRNLEILGEAARNIETRYPDFGAAHPGFPLSQAYQMRNALAHSYFKVDLDIVWRTVVRDVPTLKQHAHAARAALWPKHDEP